jgi:thiol:disulfide interchange protein DsbD
MKTLLHLWMIAIAVWVGGVAAAKDAELLEPEAAFRFSAQLVNPGAIEVRYAIADGYYLYRDKFRFQLTPSEGKPGAIKYPAGKIKHDPLFGKVESYRKSVTLVIPIGAAPADGRISLTAISQGCADVGVCYPPMTSQIVFDITRLANDSAKPISSLFKK